MTALDPAPMRRCCADHGDWSTLTEHLLADFSDLTDDQVVAQVLRARSAVQAFGLSVEEELQMGEVLARHQLMLLTGEVPDAARLDPEVHVRSAMQ